MTSRPLSVLLLCSITASCAAPESETVTEERTPIIIGGASLLTAGLLRAIADAIRQEMRMRAAIEGLDAILEAIPAEVGRAGSEAWMSSPPAKTIDESGEPYQTHLNCPIAGGPTYSVPHGRYRSDGLVSVSETHVEDGVTRMGSTGPEERALHMGPLGRDSPQGGIAGWSFAVGGNLQRVIQFQGLTGTSATGFTHRCDFSMFYRYVSQSQVLIFTPEPGAAPVICQHDLQNASGGGLEPLRDCLFPSGCSRPNRWISTEGHVVLEVGDSGFEQPLLRWPDGREERFVHNDAIGAFIPGNEANYGYHGAVRPAAHWTTKTITDVHGLVTTFSHENGQVVSVTDPQLRTTHYFWEDGRLVRVEEPGIFEPEVTEYEWSQRTWNPAEVMDDVACLQRNARNDGSEINPIIVYFGEVVPCAPLTYWTLDAVRTREGDYEFSYDLQPGVTGWGALFAARNPAGLEERFEYDGGATVPDGEICSPNNWSLVPPVRRLGKRTVIPGPNTAYVSEYSLEGTEAPGGGPCLVEWTRTRLPDGRVERSGTCAGAQPFHGQPFAIELWSSDGELVEGTYFGVTSRVLAEAPQLIDGKRAGELFIEYETLTGYSVFDRTYLDLRPARIIHYLDGLWWAETMTYDRTPEGSRTFGNVIRKQTLDGGGQVLLETRSKLVDGSTYLLKNMIRLVERSELWGYRAPLEPDQPPDLDTLVRLSLTDTKYDEYALEPVDAFPGSVARGRVGRGLPTRTIKYADAAGATGGIEARTTYYCTGQPHTESRPYASGSAPAGFTRHDPFRGVCSPEARIVASTTQLPDPGNGVVQSTTHYHDCYTGLSLTTVAADGTIGCRAYDGAERLIQTALPGDGLADGPGVFFDRERCPAGAPTTSVNRVDFRSALTTTKNGGAGLRSIVFTDALHRVLESCTEVDPSTNQGNEAVCIWFKYDDQGREVAETLPAYLSRFPDQFSEAPLGLGQMETEFDAKGRKKLEREPGGFITTYEYGVEDGRLVTIVRPPRAFDPQEKESDEPEIAAEAGEAMGFARRVHRNILGHEVRVDRHWTQCPGGWCSTYFAVDAAGRIWATQEPVDGEGGGHVTRAVFDDLGRQIEADDPDRGHLRTQYDAAGNVEWEEDANGERVSYRYDVLGRVIEKTLPAVPGVEGSEDEARVTYAYDGVDATIPSGLEGVASSPNFRGPIGKLTSSGNALTRTWNGYDGLGRSVATYTQLDTRELYAAAIRVGYPIATSIPGRGSVTIEEEVPHRCTALADRFDCSGVEEVIANSYDRAGALTEIAVRERPSGAETTLIRRLDRNVRGDITFVEYGNGARTTRSFGETDLRLSRLVTHDAGGRSIQDLSYGYDAHHNLIRSGDGVRPELGAEHRYDAWDRLLSMRSGDVVERYRYDAVGNLRAIALFERDQLRRERTSSYGGQNSDGTPRAAHAVGSSSDRRISPNGEESRIDTGYDYDRGGRMISHRGRTIRWNAEDMAVATVGEDGALLNRKFFVGEKLWKKIEAELTTYYLGALRLEIRDGLTSRRVYYSEFAERAPEHGSIVYHHPDHLRSASVITGSSGEAIYSETYWPYGETRAVEQSENYVPQKRFNGHEQESSTGLYDYGARLYDPALGRWISPDNHPSEGFTKYVYVGNNPVTRRDADGHCWIPSPQCRKAGEWLKEVGKTVLSDAWGTVKTLATFVQEKATDPLGMMTPVTPRDIARAHAQLVGTYESARSAVNYLRNTPAAQMKQDTKQVLKSPKTYGHAIWFVAEALLTKRVAGAATTRSPQSIAKATERKVLNSYMFCDNPYNTCRTGAMLNAISGTRAGYKATILTYDIVNAAGEWTRHAITLLERGGKQFYLSWGRVAKSVDELFKHEGYQSYTLGAADDLPSHVKYTVDNQKLYPLPGDPKPPPAAPKP